MRKISKSQISNLQNNASATIISLEDGTFKVSEKDTHVASLLNLILIKDTIEKYEDIISIDNYFINSVKQHMGVEDYNFYTFKTSIFQDNIVKLSTSKFKLTTNIKSGNAGNIALSFFSIFKDVKIINQDMYNIINKGVINIVTKYDDDFYSFTITNIDDFILFLNKIDKYEPQRIFIENVSINESSIFYMKPINAALKKEYDKIMSKWANQNGLYKISGKKIRDKYGLDITEYLKDTSNNHYFVKEELGKLKKIFLIELPLLFLSYEGDTIYNYNEDSFLYNRYIFKKSNPIFQKIDIMDIYENVSSSKLITPNIFSLFLRKYNPLIHDRKKYQTRSSYTVIVNDTDERIIRDLKKYDKKIFEIVNHKDNNADIIFLPKNLSNVIVRIFDREGREFNNINHQCNFVQIYKSNLSFEREKALSVMFIQDFVNKLFDDGHSNIEVKLEKMVTKYNGKQGFLDVIITSEKNGKVYGQIWEMKAVYNFSDIVKNECEIQAESYNITKILNQNNILNSYSGEEHYKVKLLNLVSWFNYI